MDLKSAAASAQVPDTRQDVYRFFIQVQRNMIVSLIDSLTIMYNCICFPAEGKAESPYCAGHESSWLKIPPKMPNEPITDQLLHHRLVPGVGPRGYACCG